MKLYIKQRIFTLTDKYNIFDDFGNTIFTVEKQFFSFPGKFYLRDQNDAELFEIRKNFTLFLSSYEIFKDNYLAAKVQKELTLFKSKFSVESSYGNYQIDGDIFSWDFEIKKDGLPMGSVHKEILSWGDSYVLNIYDDENAGFFCAFVIAIDNCLHNGNNN